MDSSALIGVLGVTLATASLTWQFSTHILSGGRAKAVLKVGALSPDGRGLVSGPVEELSPEWLENMRSQGFTRPVAVVTVTNRGRMPVSVAGWKLLHPSGIAFRPIADSIGPALPYRLEAGSSETWAVPLRVVIALAESAGAVWTSPKRPRDLIGAIVYDANKSRGRDGIVALVELGDGRTRYSRESFPAAPLPE